MTGTALGVYGTLLTPSVRALVLGEVPVRSARLRGWERVYVAGKNYPGIRPSAGAEIDVAIVTEVTAPMLTRADAFEGSEYVRERLPVVFDDNAGADVAFFYIPTPVVPLSDTVWHYDELWRTEWLHAFLAEARAALGNGRAVFQD